MLDELKHFLAIVEHGTFREAARRVHLSQPALTAAMHRLEEHFGARLLHRGRSGAVPTAAGAALVPRARAALAALEDGKRAIEEIEGLHAGEVRVGAGATACTYLLPPILAAFRREHARVRFLLRETTSEEALDGLHAGDLDLAILSEGVRGPRGRRARVLPPTHGLEGVQHDLWRTDPLVLVCAPGVDAATAPHVTFRRGATTRALFERFFPEAEIVMELGSIAAVKGNVRAGVGVALVSENAVIDDLARGLLVRVPDSRTPIVRELRVAHRGVERLPPAAAALREVLLAERRRRPARTRLDRAASS
ncbi:MAG: LysR family transcriptional regulator [Sandaracinus sp.]|nr:LysR family transcriptional regulator [Sandaracinus sp.]MCB9633859.1 LysR family transcriptional regulator [Sandaracinus sp.]MCB9637103.1 LysR family transcriptional regulator [Sandaracinus sp.]